MNSDIANILKGYLEPLAFTDRLGGLVKAVTFVQDNGTDVVRKVMPVDCNVSGEDCTSSKYKHLVPDSRYRSVMYFEDGGVSNLNQDSARDFTYESSLKLVCWLNLKKMGKTSCNNSALAIATIQNAFPTRFFNNGIYQRIRISIDGQDPKTDAIFNKYTYDSEKTQFLMYPYDYFALNITVRFCISKACITDWTNQEEICANV